MTKKRDASGLTEAVQELITHNLLIDNLSLADDIADAMKRDESPRLEPLSEYFDSLTAPKLTEIAKIVNVAIKNVNVLNFVEVQEVSLNPFMRLHQQLEVLSATSDESIPDLDSLIGISNKISESFSS